MSILLQTCPSYSGDLNSKTPGDGKIAFLHWGDTLGYCIAASRHKVNEHVVMNPEL
jgi:hypothetical protein